MVLITKAVRGREWKKTCGTCFVARRLEVVAVAWLLWISWCVLGAAGFRDFFSSFFFLGRTRPAAGMRPPCLFNLSTSGTGGACRFHRAQVPNAVARGIFLTIFAHPLDYPLAFLSSRKKKAIRSFSQTQSHDLVDCTHPYPVVFCT